MPVNRNALIRYRTIDNCLRNRQRKWTLEDLIDACSEALYEYEGIDKGVSKRSIQMDIQLMRSDKLGYNAPIVVKEKKYYSYEDPDYSITNIPLTDQDLGKLTEVVEILRQFKGFSHFQDLSGMVQRLENKIHSAKTKQEPVIDFEKNEFLKGLEHIETLYHAIIQKKAVAFTYHSFKARSASSFTFHPYFLKEYRNRWFVLGVKKKNTPVMILALDRIVSIKDSFHEYASPIGFNVAKFFHDVIGVTVNQDKPPERILFFADNETSPYIITKPLHHSQQVVENLSNGTVFSINVQLNFELEREILGFGDRIKVIAPERLKRRIKKQFENALDLYQNELSSTTLQTIFRKIEQKGFATLNHVFGKKEINQIRGNIYGYQKNNPEGDSGFIRNLFSKIPSLKHIIFNPNLLSVLSQINRNLFLTKAIYFDKSKEAINHYNWHQNVSINSKGKIEVEGFTRWSENASGYDVFPPTEILKSSLIIHIHLDDTNVQNGALKVIPGSHNKKLSSSEVQLITQNSIPFECEIDMGGIQIMRPLLLKAFSKASSQKPMRLIHLEFNSIELPKGLEWWEKQELNLDL